MAIVRTISQLPRQQNLNDSSYFEISVPIETVNGTEVTKFMSKKISSGDVKRGILALLSADFKNQFKKWTTYDLDEWNSWLTQLIYGEKDSSFPLQKGSHNFADLPKIGYNKTDHTKPVVLTSFVAANNEVAINLGTLKNFSQANNSLYIGGGDRAIYKTRHYNVENLEYQNVSGIDYAPSTEDERHNVYVFKVKNYKSESWRAPSSGLFVCYGWLDEAKANSVNNANRWVALEANFNGKWKVVQLQPFISNEYISYVGFSIPIAQGTELRITTGFKVGTNSNKYQSYPGSMSNHIANAFVGGVYTYPMGSTMDPDDIPTGTGTWQEIAELKDATVRQLRSKLNAVIHYLNEHFGGNSHLAPTNDPNKNPDHTPHDN